MPSSRQTADARGTRRRSPFMSLATLGVCGLRITGMDTELLYAAALGRVDTMTSAYAADARRQSTMEPWPDANASDHADATGGIQYRTPQFKTPHRELRCSLPCVRDRATPTSPTPTTRSPTPTLPPVRPAHRSSLASSAWSSCNRATTGPTTHLTLEVLRRLGSRGHGVAQVKERHERTANSTTTTTSAFEPSALTSSPERTDRLSNSSTTCVAWHVAPNHTAGTYHSTHRGRIVRDLLPFLATSTNAS